MMTDALKINCIWHIHKVTKDYDNRLCLYYGAYTHKIKLKTQCYTSKMQPVIIKKIIIKKKVQYVNFRRQRLCIFETITKA